jgi:hypothetical protein
MNYLAIRKSHRGAKDDIEPNIQPTEIPQKSKMRFPNPLPSLSIILDKENALLLFYNAFLFAAFYDITATIPSQFAEVYHFNDFQIGLCYIPFGVGCMCAALTNGQFLDRNFARWCRKLGVEIRKGFEQDLRNFPVEKARLEVAFPACYIAASLVLAFGWILDVNGPLPAALVVLFLSSYSMSVAFNVTGTLLVDFYPEAPATATAANNLVRCLLGAGATGVVIPILDGMGRGWTFTFLSLFLVASSPMLAAVYFWGMQWRQQRIVRDERAKKKETINKARLLSER